MSLASTRVGMRFICYIEREVVGAEDAWGGTPVPTWAPSSTVRCSAWSSAVREAVSTDRTVVVEDNMVSVPLGTDVTENDRVSSVTTATGAPYFLGPMGISSVTRYSDHMELSLERLR